MVDEPVREAEDKLDRRKNDRHREFGGRKDRDEELTGETSSETSIVFFENILYPPLPVRDCTDLSHPSSTLGKAP